MVDEIIRVGYVSGIGHGAITCPLFAVWGVCYGSVDHPRHVSYEDEFIHHPKINLKSSLLL